VSVTHDTIADVEVLDNPVWHALTGPQAEFSEGSELALRFDPDVTVFGALPDVVTADAWDALRTLVGSGGVALLARSELAVPQGWTTPFLLGGHQYLAPADFGERARPDDFVRLTEADVPEMLALIERTKPGPFAKRTVELGSYFGLRNDTGRLVAMTGVRMRPTGFAELSAVCTDDAYRGRGLATALMQTVAAAIRARGEQPILHVAVDNTNAIALYDNLGFTRRATFEFTLVQAPR
jgi:ribosomal protein S18 acetylase RimI-like enzyme